MTQADAEGGGLSLRRDADELAHGRQPRRDLVVPAAHLAAEDEQAVVTGEVLRQLVTRVRTADVELDAGLGEPLADAAGWAGVLVLDDEKAHRVTARLPRPTRAPAPMSARPAALISTVGIVISQVRR